ncbi:hypothetical protein PoB_000183300 [Plakobranchus ocellatus]|uniref:Uncharacterized protein n=1 Tax=Plakobranchus ocellatus TaxID=259542 RepID=A0AAV3XYN4_9GAST|nr:hypothetical protein PoB_000183300 [Plakobranchus ocellatus]
MLDTSVKLYTRLLTATLALCTSCQCLKFSLLQGQRITSGATKLGEITKEATVTQGDWTLVFRAQSSIGVSVWDTWTNTGLHNDNPVPEDFPLPCLRLTEYGSCDRHFRSHILDSWSNVKEVWFSLVKSDTEVAYTIFNGTGTNRDSWFSQDKILASTWAPEIQAESTLSDTGVFGHDLPPYAERRFYLFGPHNGCEIDWFYTFTIDKATDTCVDHGLWHITFSGFPTIFYSASPGKAGVRTDQGYVEVSYEDSNKEKKSIGTLMAVVKRLFHSASTHYIWKCFGDVDKTREGEITVTLKDVVIRAKRQLIQLISTLN